MRKTAKIAGFTLALAVTIGLATQVMAQTAVPEPGKSKKIDEIKQRGVLRAAAIGEFPWLPENTTGTGDKWSGPAWVLTQEIAKRLHTTPKYVSRIARQMGRPKFRTGPKPGASKKERAPKTQNEAITRMEKKYRVEKTQTEAPQIKRLGTNRTSVTRRGGRLGN